MKALVAFFLLLLSISWNTASRSRTRRKYNDIADANTPEQVHLSWDGDASHMTITWNTPASTGTGVQYGLAPDQLTIEVTGTKSRFISPGIHLRIQYIHRATMIDLEEKTIYYYRVGNGSLWSQVYSFQSLQSGTNWSPRLAVFGDMGLDNAQSIKRLTKMVRKRQIDMILHVGDFAYDMHENEGKVGDAFMRMIEPVAAYVPYQTAPGNHEAMWNFTHYKNRFTMPGTERGMFYSFSIGPATVISFATEFYFYPEYGPLEIPRQFKWFENELKRLSDVMNRKESPWIITMGHRPMYCSNNDTDDCTKHESIVRTGLPLFHAFGLEKLFYRYGVDLCIWAHEHSYERLFPVYDRQVVNGTVDPTNPYHNPRGPVHVISGSAGCREKTDDFKNPEPWSAFRNNGYGFMRMNIVNKTHMTIKQVSDEKGGKIIDSFVMIKDQEGVYGRQ